MFQVFVEELGSCYSDDEIDDLLMEEVGSGLGSGRSSFRETWDWPSDRHPSRQNHLSQSNRSTPHRHRESPLVRDGQGGESIASVDSSSNAVDIVSFDANSEQETVHRQCREGLEVEQCGISEQSVLSDPTVDAHMGLRDMNPSEARVIAQSPPPNTLDYGFENGCDDSDERCSASPERVSPADELAAEEEGVKQRPSISSRNSTPEYAVSDTSGYMSAGASSEALISVPVTQESIQTSLISKESDDEIITHGDSQLDDAHSNSLDDIHEASALEEKESRVKSQLRTNSRKPQSMPSSSSMPSRARPTGSLLPRPGGSALPRPNTGLPQPIKRPQCPTANMGKPAAASIGAVKKVNSSRSLLKSFQIPERKQ